MIKKHVNNQNIVNIRLDTIEKEIDLKFSSAKFKTQEEQFTKKNERIENPFMQNKENFSGFSNQNHSFEKKQSNFQEYLKNSKKEEKLSDTSSDLEDLLIDKESKFRKIKPKSSDKNKKKRSRSASNLKKNEKNKPVLKENNSRSVKKQRKVSPLPPDGGRSILNRISLERKAKEHKIKELMKKEKKIKKSIK